MKRSMSGTNVPFRWDGRRWHGHTEKHCLSMSQETFQEYVRVYQQGWQGRGGPTQEEVMQRVTQPSYWAYARYDRNIHCILLPGCIMASDEGRKGA
jgi:hypothetical protein